MALINTVMRDDMFTALVNLVTAGPNTPADFGFDNAILIPGSFANVSLLTIYQAMADALIVILRTEMEVRGYITTVDGALQSIPIPPFVTIVPPNDVLLAKSAQVL